MRFTPCERHRLQLQELARSIQATATPEALHAAAAPTVALNNEIASCSDCKKHEHPRCGYCDGDAVSGLAIEHSGLQFCSVTCLWDAAFCDGFDTALDKVRAQKFEPIGEVLEALELETINTAPRR